MSDVKEEKETKRKWSLKAVCAVALAAFVTGAVVAGGIGYAVLGNPAEEAEANGILEGENETETPAVTEDAGQNTDGQEETVTTASEENEDTADAQASEEKRIFQEYLDEQILEYDGAVDLEKQARAFDWNRTYTIYRMADGHMAWTNISGICGSEICDLDGDGIEELIVFKLNGDERLMGSGEMSVCAYEAIDGKVDWPKTCSKNLSVHAGGAELTWSLLQADGAVYLFYHDNYRGVDGEYDSTNEAALYRYDGEHFYSPLRIERRVGEAGNVTYTAYQYDTGAKLLSEEVIYDGPQDVLQGSGLAHYYKRIEELFGAYGISIDSETALKNGQNIYHEIMEAQDEQRLLTLNMWAVSQGDFLAHAYQLNDQNGVMPAYQRFLNGEESVRIREGIWDEYDGGPDEVWTIQELLDMACGYYLEDYRNPQITGEYRPSVGYTYLDCGGDGMKELAIRFVGLGMESTEDLTMVIACRDAALEVVYARHSWSRSGNELRYHGCIRHHGSSGARDNYAGMDYIDGNGDLQMVYSAHASGRQGWALCELEDYDDTNASEYVFTDTTYSIGDTEYEILEFDEDIPEEIGREYIDYLIQKGENVITEEELGGLIEARMEQLGIEKTWAEEEELAWSYCYW